jgi:hypothetical protein
VLRDMFEKHCIRRWRLSAARYVRKTLNWTAAVECCEICSKNTVFDGGVVLQCILFIYRNIQSLTIYIQNTLNWTAAWECCEIYSKHTVFDGGV